MIQTLWKIVHFGGKLRHFRWKIMQIQPFESIIIHDLNDFTQSIQVIYLILQAEKDDGLTEDCHSYESLFKNKRFSKHTKKQIYKTKNETKTTKHFYHCRGTDTHQCLVW
jgi:hypothetical protein